METVKGVRNGYLIGGDTPIDIPIEDIEKFTLRHQNGRNGLVVEAVIKPELVSFVNVRHNDADEYGVVKRQYEFRKIHIRNKDNPKFHRLLRKTLDKKEVREKQMGMNAGTPASISWVSRWKEILPQEIFNEVS